MIQQLTLTLLVAFSAVAGWKEYSDAARHIKFKYPDTWTQQDVGDMAIAFLSPTEGDSDKFQENINLLMQDISSQPMGLTEFTDATKSQIEQYLGKEALLSIKDITLAKQKAKEIVYNMEYEGRKLKVKQFFFIKDNIAYVFTFTAEPEKFTKYEGIATEAMQSLVFI